MRKFNRADSNRGGALLSVIIAMTVVGILGTLVLSMSYTNFKMKQIDKKSKDNFYSAEAVLDEICVGLQREISEQYKNAYTTVMENYGYYDTAAEMTKDFNLEFVLNMVDALQSGDAEHYDLTKLRAYVNPANYPSGDTYSIETTSAEVTTNGTTTVEYYNELATLEDGLTIRNIIVNYVSKGYVNTISTDIVITIPKIEFARILTMPEIADYVIIAQDGMQVTGSSFWNLQGKAFAGSGIDLLPGSMLNVDNAASTILVTGGDISVKAGSIFKTASTTTLWANSITASGNSSSVGNNQISVLGRTYIKDDTTLNGSGNVLKLGGQYYGYSNNDADASGSSAIIINGANTTVDMSELKALVLAGTSFVGTKAAADATGIAATMNTANVLMGDSVAVKGNQIAYLVPTECKGITSNPMSYEDYQELILNTKWKEDALNTVLSTIRRSLASYGSIGIQPIFTTRDGGSVYFYVSFTDADVASQYFMDYYGGEGGAKLKQYLNRYVSTFSFNTTDMNRIVTQGNYLVPDTEVAGKAVYSSNTGDVATSAQELSNYQSSYEALCIKLVENKSALNSSELDQTVYQNLIDQNAAGTGKVDLFMADAKNGLNTLSDNMEYKKIVSGTSSVDVVTIWGSAADKGDVSKVCCIIVDNDDAGDAAYTIPAGGSGIIIATGDVNIPRTASVAWNGVIICNGEMVMDGGTVTAPLTLRSDSGVVAQAMQYMASITKTAAGTSTVDDYAVMNFFIGNGEFSVGASSDADGAKVDVRDCLSFKNWKSE